MALKIVYPICCGKDVYKTFVIACIAETDKKEITTYKSHRFSTYTSGLELLIYQIAVSRSAQIDFILTTPGIKSTLSAIKIISEIGVNIEFFPSTKHLCSWAGLTPTNNESAGKKKTVRVSKAGGYIKPLLVQCATAVVKSEKHPEIRNHYLRLKKRRGHN